MSPLEYEVALPPDVRWARVKILCKHHPDQMIAEWSTFDGQQALVWLGEGSEEQYIGWLPDVETKRYLDDSPTRVLFSTATAAQEDWDSPHMRLVLSCGRASCSYQPKIRQERIKDLNDLVLALWADGVEEQVITDLESLLGRTK